MLYTVYDKDLFKDLQKSAGRSYTGPGQISVKEKIGFLVEIRIDGVTNEGAISRDMLLKRLIRARTDPVYDTFLRRIDTVFKEASKEAVLSQAELDGLWAYLQTFAEKAHEDITKAAIPVLDEYLADRNLGKRASKKFAYKKYKSVLAFSGGIATSAVAIAGAVMSGGAAIAGAGLAIAGTIKAGHDMVREFERQKKSVADHLESVKTTIDFLDKSFYDDVNPTGREVAAKVVSAWFGGNIKSIKKLQQDVKLLKDKANQEFLLASKDAAKAAPWHEQSKIIKKSKADVERNLDDLIKQFGTAPEIRKKVETVRRELRKLDDQIALTKETRDKIVDLAAARRDAAKKILSSVPQYEKITADFKADRGDIVKFVDPFLTVLTLGANLATQDYQSLSKVPNPADIAKVINRNDAIAGLCMTVGDSLKELGMMVKGRIKA